MRDLRTVIDVPLVRRLIAGQFPQWSQLPLTAVQPGGWDNRTFRLGDAMTVRLPSGAGYASQVDKEQLWLPRLAPRLPLPIPSPVALGMPAAGYPWSWSVYRWLAGKPASTDLVDDPARFALALADFLNALHRIEPDGPPAGAHSAFRGAPLSTYDGGTRTAILALSGAGRRQAALRAWERALAEEWSGPPVWFHGDFAAGNLLVRHGVLAAVIDFGCCGVGDPACDFAIGWTMLSAEGRALLRSATGVDPGTWARGRGWALWKALITLADKRSMHADSVLARHVVDTILDGG